MYICIIRLITPHSLTFIYLGSSNYSLHFRSLMSILYKVSLIIVMMFLKRKYGFVSSDSLNHVEPNWPYTSNLMQIHIYKCVTKNQQNTLLPIGLFYPIYYIFVRQIYFLF